MRRIWNLRVDYLIGIVSRLNEAEPDLENVVLEEPIFYKAIL